PDRRGARPRPALSGARRGPHREDRGQFRAPRRGRDHADRPIERRIAIVTDYDGPATPSAAAVVLAQKLPQSRPPRAGAFPCIGLVTLGEILAYLRPLGVWHVRGDESGWINPPALATRPL